jgi:DNA-3-methyladenine glycosylase I
MFHSGLSWEIVLNKRESFKKAFKNYNLNEFSNMTDEDVDMLLNNVNIVRHRKKIESAINNAKVFKAIQNEFESFAKYLWSFTNCETIYETGKTKSDLSDGVSKDLKTRGMKFLGTTTVYAYLQAIGIINSHDKNCFLYKNKKES